MAGFVLNEQTARLILNIKNLDKKFRKSCDQILLLNNQIEDLQSRYERAMSTNRRAFRYSLRLRLATLEGVRNMFYEYASRCADELEELQNSLVDTGGQTGMFQGIEWEPVGSSDEDDVTENAMDVSSSSDANEVIADVSDLSSDSHDVTHDNTVSSEVTLSDSTSNEQQIDGIEIVTDFQSPIVNEIEVGSADSILVSDSSVMNDITTFKNSTIQDTEMNVTDNAQVTRVESDMSVLESASAHSLTQLNSEQG